MRLVTFKTGYGARLGAVDGEHVVDLNAAYAALLESRGVPRAHAHARADVPADATRFLTEGGDARRRAEEAVTFSRAGSAPGVRVVRRGLSLLPVVPRPPKVICVGLNYRDHAEETGMKIPDHPVFFSKFTSCLIGAGQPIVLPRVSEQLDYEAELAVVIGRPGRYISETDAYAHVAGYTILNDVSVRDYQMRTGQWLIGKVFDRSTPVGPELVTADEVPHPDALRLSTTVNGRVLQDSNTSNFIFGIPQVIASISEILTLEPGDLIATGTPAGVGFARKPPIFLRDGDAVTIEVEALGRLENPVVAEAVPARAAAARTGAGRRP
jgi:acylpyruvate hydrolase